MEELQCLWSEVRKEIEKMEEHLSRRLSSVLTGNDNFNTLTTMDIVQTVSIQYSKTCVKWPLKNRQN